MRRSIALAVLGFSLLTATRAFADGLETSAEKAVGRIASRALMDASGVDADPLLQDWVKHIGAKVAARSPRTDIRPDFRILGTDIANAFTLPGGSVFVTRGLLDSVDSDDELAGVLAHETGHVAKKHAIQQIEGNLIFAALGLTLNRTGNEGAATITSVYNVFRALHKSREMEAQADEQGLTFAYEAGYDPNGLVEFFSGISGGRQSFLDTYLATHPAPEKRITAARANPLVAQNEPGIRESVARSYAARGYPGLAAVVQQRGNPFLFPPPAYPPLDPALQSQHDAILRESEAGRKDLVATYKARRVGITLQQVLLVNSNLGDLRWAYLASHAYAVQSRVDDCYARTLRILRVAPNSFDGLAAYSGNSGAAADAAQGRTELEQAVTRVRGATRPLERASVSVAGVLVDLNNHYLRPRGNSEPWLRYAALESALRYAESELSRADRASGQAWRLLSLAQIRRYQARLTELAPAGDRNRRILWHRLITDRFGLTSVPGNNDDDDSETGMQTVRAALAKETGKSEAEIEQRRENTPWADWTLFQKGTPENIATAMRLLTLDMEREIFAEARSRTGVSAPKETQTKMSEIR